MTKTNLLPDEIEVYHDKFGDLLAFKDFDLRVPGTRYVRADLVSTPNKPAEVDDREAIKVVNQMYDGLGYLEKHDDALMSFNVKVSELKAIRAALSGHLATGKGGGDKASSGFKLTGEHVRQIMRSPAYWREKDPAVMKMVQECFEYLTEKDRAEIKSLEQTEQQKTVEPCGDVQEAYITVLGADCTINGHYIVRDKIDHTPLAYVADLRHANLLVSALKQPAAPTQIDAGELEESIWYCREDWQHKDGYEALYEHMDVIIKAARAHLEKSKGGV